MSHRRRPSVRPAALAALLLAGAASFPASCASTSDASWTAAEFQTENDRILWEYVLLALDKNDYPLGAGIDPLGMKVDTGWQLHLSPFRGKGLRRRAHVRLVHDEEGRQRLEVRVEVEHNTALVRPTDIRYAQWEAAPDDEAAAQVLLQHVRAYVGEPLELKRH